MGSTTHLTVLALSLALPCLLYAHTWGGRDGVFLSVYRSPVVRDDDPKFEPVAQILDSVSHELVERKTLPDPDMLFGQAESLTYFLKGIT